MSSRRALLVGIDRYDRLPKLQCSVKDAEAMAERLGRQDDGYRNYHCRMLGSPAEEKLTRKHLMDQIRQLFANFDGAVLFYFSGHGHTSDDLGGFLVTEDGDWSDPGLPMRDLITLANNSKAWDVLLILDCCYAGDLGDLPHTSGPQVQLRQGVTILAASAQTAIEVDDHSLFTGLILEGLEGGAADLRGRVSAASLYSYAEQGLGPWQQRPVYKSYASRLPVIRRCRPAVEDDVLRRLPDRFPKAREKVCLDAAQDLEDFDRLRQAGLLQTVDGKPLTVTDPAQQLALTPLGRHYRYLAVQGLI